MFDRVAPRYDLANTVLSAGQDRHWRRVAVRALDPFPGALVLDVAAGTGMLSQELRAAGAQVLALDLSYQMLRVGARRDRAGQPGLGGLWWCNADALRLPLADATCDGVTIAFGLRNLGDPAAGLAEFARVVRPGGRLVVQAGSPYFAHEAFWSIERTIAASGLRTRPYHVDVPSFGDWGFVLARTGAAPGLRLAPPPGRRLRFLDGPTLAAAATFPPDRARVDVGVNTLNRPRLLDYERRGYMDY
jgi:SAM-dependent methyltransferase